MPPGCTQDLQCLTPFSTSLAQGLSPAPYGPASLFPVASALEGPDPSQLQTPGLLLVPAGHHLSLQHPCKEPAAHPRAFAVTAPSPTGLLPAFQRPSEQLP